MTVLDDAGGASVEAPSIDTGGGVTVAVTSQLMQSYRVATPFSGVSDVAVAPGPTGELELFVVVGGAVLNVSRDPASETGWSSGGGGVSRYESKPSYQSGLSYSKRANPDVAYDANPSSGFAVYDSYGGYNWNYIFGGTSAGAPQWSALIALADQGRINAGKKALDGVSQTLPALYKMSTGTDGTKQLYDVTSGRNGVGSAGTGFDLVTGRGTPRRGEGQRRPASKICT